MDYHQNHHAGMMTWQLWNSAAMVTARKLRSAVQAGSDLFMSSQRVGPKTVDSFSFWAQFLCSIDHQVQIRFYKEEPITLCCIIPMFI